jgi:ABC-type uncharacterized transport system involved in gliding motility auxiliary subunit
LRLFADTTVFNNIMEANKKNRRLLRLQGASFAVLFLAAVGLVAWLSTRYHFQADWTAAGRHTLAPASVALLAELQDPIRITAFARQSELVATRRQISDLVGRYQRHKPDLTLNFVDPDMAPDRVRSEGISMDGEMVVEYQGRKLHVQQMTEQALTNTLHKLARAGERKVLFLEGHGERNPEGGANHDYGAFGEQLRNKGFHLARLNLTATPEIPADAALLVIASPQVDLFPGEVRLIQDYVERGGNLLWLAEPEGRHQLDPLAAQLGLAFHPGTVVDPTTQLLGIDNAAFAVVAEYPPHAITRDLASVTLFPFAAAIDPARVGEPWQATPFLRTVPRAWAETGVMQGAISYDAGSDVAGPLTLAIALERARPTAEENDTQETAADDHDEAGPQQRVVVIGDGDFLANSYLGNGANLELGERLINWLSHDDALMHIPPKAAVDTRLELSPLLSGIIGVSFLFLIPGGLVIAGVVIWLKRRKR